MGYDIDIMICDIDYYIGFIDCEIWLLRLDRIGGRNWKEGWKVLEIVLEDFGSGGKWWSVGILDGVVIATNALRLMCAYIAIFWQCQIYLTF